MICLVLQEFILQVFWWNVELSWKVYESVVFVLLYLRLGSNQRLLNARIDQIGRGRGGVGLWAKSTLLTAYSNIIRHLINTISMREKYSSIGCHWIYGHSTLWVSKWCKNFGKPRVLHDFDTPRLEWPYIQWQPIKESYSPWPLPYIQKTWPLLLHCF